MVPQQFVDILFLHTQPQNHAGFHQPVVTSKMSKVSAPSGRMRLLPELNLYMQQSLRNLLAERNTDIVRVALIGAYILPAVDDPAQPLPAATVAAT